MFPDNNALVKAKTRAADRLRRPWRWYKDRSPAVRILIPSGLAFACLVGAWTVLNEGEYGVALASAALFLIFGIQAARETAWPRGAKLGVSIALVLIAVYSGAVIVIKKGDKPWTNLTLFTVEEETVQSIPQPSVATNTTTPTLGPEEPVSGRLLLFQHARSEALYGMKEQPFPYQAEGDKNAVDILCRIDLPMHNLPTLAVYIPRTATVATATDAAVYAINQQDKIVEILLNEIRKDESKALALKARPVKIQQIIIYHETFIERAVVIRRAGRTIAFQGPRMRSPADQ